jgi:hypothetical protein
MSIVARGTSARGVVLLFGNAFGGPTPRGALFCAQPEMIASSLSVSQRGGPRRFTAHDGEAFDDRRDVAFEGEGVLEDGAWNRRGIALIFGTGRGQQ